MNRREYVSNRGEVRVVTEHRDGDLLRVSDLVDRTRTAEPVMVDGKVVGWRIKGGE